MTREELFKFAFRCAEHRLRKSGPVFSEAEIMEDYPEQPSAPIARGQWCNIKPIHLPNDFYDVLRLG